MVIFILVFFAMVIAVSITAVAGFSFYLKRKTKSLETTNKKQFNEPPPYRSLFEPSDEELRADEREAQMRVEAGRKETEQNVLFEKSEKARDFERTWRSEPAKQNTIELLRLASASESAEVFSQMAENVLQIWRENKIENLTSTDLADLLDSHFRTLPQQERISGAVFRIKQEIENLRRKSE